MDDFIEEFLFTKSKLTQIHYTSDLKHFRKWLKQANIPEVVTHIRFLDVQRYLKTMPESPSRRRKIITLKSFFHWKRRKFTRSYGKQKGKLNSWSTCCSFLAFVSQKHCDWKRKISPMENDWPYPSWAKATNGAMYGLVPLLHSIYGNRSKTWGKRITCLHVSLIIPDGGRNEGWKSWTQKYHRIGCVTDSAPLASKKGAMWAR